MSLDFNYGKVKNYKEVCLVEETRQGETGTFLAPKTDALIWKTIAIGMDHISEKNVDEFYIRCAMWERLFNASCYKTIVDDEGNKKVVDDYISYEDVIAHIGLYTNASRMTTAQFNKHFAEVARRDPEWIVQRAKTEAKEKQNEH